MGANRWWPDGKVLPCLHVPGKQRLSTMPMPPDNPVTFVKETANLLPEVLLVVSKLDVQWRPRRLWKLPLRAALELGG